MKVAVYGNNLNQGYWLVRNLRRCGMEAILLMRPYNYRQEYHDWWSDQAWCEEWVYSVDVADHEINSLEPLVANEAVRKAYDRVRDVDILFLSEDGPAFFCELNGVKKVFRSAGADLQLIPFHHRLNCRPSLYLDALKRGYQSARDCTTNGGGISCLWAFKAEWGVTADLCARYRCYQERQRRGLRQSAALIISNDQRPLVRKLGLGGIPTFCLPMPMDVDNLAEGATESSPELVRKYQDVDVLFFHPTRQFFVKGDRNKYKKGNDRLIAAYAAYLKSARKRSKLILCEKGRAVDIEAAKQLVLDLGVEEQVEWIAETPNKLLRDYYRLEKTVVCGSFDRNFQRLANVGREASFYGCPIITAFGEDYRQGYFDKEPPHVFHALAKDEIVDAMIAADGMTLNVRRRLRKQSRAWFDKNLSFDVIHPHYLNIFESVLREPRS